MTGRADGGLLILVATPIGNLGDLSPRAVGALAEADVIACEDTRHTRHLLSHAGITGKKLVSIHDHNEAAQVRSVLEMIAAGRNVAVVSDAGTPGISDPGGRLVAGVAAAGASVTVIPGPSAAIAALVVSGLPTGRFCFEGYLPRRGSERRSRLEAIRAERRTTVLYEAPHRLGTTLSDLIEACGPLRAAVVARELTKVHEEVLRGCLGDLAERARQSQPRGEHVIVVAGAPAPAPLGDSEIEEALSERLSTGAPRREAVSTVATELGVPRRRVYEAALRLRERGTSS